MDGFRKLGSDPNLDGFFLYLTAFWVSALDWSMASAALATFLSMLLIKSP